MACEQPTVTPVFTGHQNVDTIVQPRTSLIFSMSVRCEAR